MSSKHVCLLVLGACSFNSAGTEPLGGSVKLTGTVTDFKSKAEITEGTLDVHTTDLNPPPVITVTGTTFDIDKIPENAVFDVVVGVDPTHYPTANTITVVDVDRDVTLSAVSRLLVDGLANACGQTVTGGGVVIARFVDGSDVGRPQVKAVDLSISTGVVPCFLDDNFARLADQTQTGSSGWAIFFKVPGGYQHITPGPSAPLTFANATVRVTDSVVTLAKILVHEGAAEPLPADVSFSRQIMPIFQLPTGTSGRGCVRCHSKKQPGADLGGLALEPNGNGMDPVAFAYSQLVIDRPGIRVNRETPVMSLVLTRPTRGYADTHLDVFLDESDRDYRLLLAWITQGAKQN